MTNSMFMFGLLIAYAMYVIVVVMFAKTTKDLRNSYMRIERLEAEVRRMNTMYIRIETRVGELDSQFGHALEQMVEFSKSYVEVSEKIEKNTAWISEQQNKLRIQFEEVEKSLISTASALTMLQSEVRVIKATVPAYSGSKDSVFTDEKNDAE